MQKGKTNLILSQIEEFARTREPTIDDIVEIIKPYEELDEEKLKENELKRRGRRYMSLPKDSDGVRDWFSNNIGAYTNVKTTISLNSLKGVKKQLNKKYKGFIKSRKKVTDREKALIEQISLFDEIN